MTRKKRILIIDDEQSVHVAIKHILKSHHDCASAYNVDEAKILLNSSGYDMVLLDLNMRAEEEGLDFIPTIRAIDKDVDIIVVSSNTKRDLVGRAISSGANAWLVKDFSPDQLLITLESVAKQRELINAQEHLQKAQKRSLNKAPLVGKSQVVQTLIKTIEKVRRTNVNVLIMGETGTGKELVARHIGAVDGRPFVAVDSATITSSMAESMLFGHEKGAFTGAVEASRGLFEEANTGTIYFDEIGNMPQEIQVKLLRVIQEKEVTRLGSRKTLPLEFRVVSATNRDLEEMSKSGEFKYDLLQRINVVPIRIPPLRERKEDIADLVQHFLKAHDPLSSTKSFSDDAMSAIMEYEWPGNVRELSNLVAYLCTMVSDRDVIEIEDLPEKITKNFKGVHRTASQDSVIKLNTVAENLADAMKLDENVDFYSYMSQLEGQVLSVLYKKYEGNISQLSKAVKVSRSHLYSKLYFHGIHK